MSQKQVVNYRDNGFWAYDVALGILLKHLIDVAQPLTTASENAWLEKAVSRWRVVAGVGEYGFEIDETWSPTQIAIFVELIDKACKVIGERVSITAEEIAAWPPILDDLRIFPRGAKEVSTGPIVELGKAIIQLANGSLPAAPKGTCWFYGVPDGRRTIHMRE